MNDSVTGMVGILLTVIVLTAFIQFGSLLSQQRYRRPL